MRVRMRVRVRVRVRVRMRVRMRVHGMQKNGDVFVFCFKPKGTHYYCAALRDAGECRIEPTARMNDIVHFRDPKFHKHVNTAQHSRMQENGDVSFFLFAFSFKPRGTHCYCSRNALARCPPAAPSRAPGLAAGAAASPATPEN